MNYYNIAFDFENKKEYFYHFTMKNFDEGIYSFDRNVVEQKLGSFLLEFLNTNFRKKRNFDNFVTKYCFIDLYAKVLRKKLYTPDIVSLKLSKKDLTEALSKMYKMFSEEFIEFSEIFRDIANTKSRYKFISALDKIDDPKSSEIFDIKAYNFSTKDYWKELEEYSDLFDSVYIDFYMLDFWGIFDTKKPFSDDIPYSFRSRDVLNIIYLSFKQIECYKHPILQCENCKNLFVPESAHDIKYCNEIFKNNKTCKQLAPKIKFQKTLEDDPLLQKYRSRYQAIQRLAKNNPEKHQALFEYYKAEGPKMRKKYLDKVITAKQFEDWINSTKIKKS